MTKGYRYAAIVVALGLILIFGWQQWKAHRVRHAADASAQYQALSDAFDAKRTDDAKTIAEALRKDYPDTAYATFAAMRLADLANGKGDLKAAAEELEWAEQHAGAPALKQLVGINLAKVKLAQGDADGALNLVDGLPKSDYAALAGEVRGDILAKLHRNDDHCIAIARGHEPFASSFATGGVADFAAPPRSSSFICTKSRFGAEASRWASASWYAARASSLRLSLARMSPRTSPASAA
jgi:predicted negative regulator of RcsB-dependent stress response